MNTTRTKAPETPVSRVEVITTVQRRRRWTTAEKGRLVEGGQITVAFHTEMHFEVYELEYDGGYAL